MSASQIHSKKEFFDILSSFTDRWNLTVTLLGMVLAFSLSYFNVSYFKLENFGLFPNMIIIITFSLSMVIFVSIFTGNIASTLLVTLAYILGLRKFSTNVEFSFWIPYFLTLLIVILLVSWISTLLKPVTFWNKFIFIFITFYFAFSFWLGTIIRDPQTVGRFWSHGLKVGIGGPLKEVPLKISGYEFPFIDLLFLAIPWLFSVLLLIYFRKERTFTNSQTRNFRILGNFLITLGFILLGTMFLLWVKPLPNNILDHTSISIMRDILIFNSSQIFIESPGNIVLFSALITWLFLVGVQFKLLGKSRDTLSWLTISENATLFVTPFFTVGILFAGLKPIQESFYKGGDFISFQSYLIILTSIWLIFGINQLISWILLLLSNLIKGRNNHID